MNKERSSLGRPRDIHRRQGIALDPVKPARADLRRPVKRAYVPATGLKSASYLAADAAGGTENQCCLLGHLFPPLLFQGDRSKMARIQP